MSQKIKTSVEIDGSLKASQIANATTDTDKFLVSDSGTVKYRTGAEVLSDLGITVNTASKLQHQVKAGVAINKGQAVYVTSADGTNMIVGLASNASEATSSKTMGLLDGTVAINGFANVVTEGLLSGLSITGAVSEGDPVWLGTGGNLIYGLANKPSAPNHLVFIGIVTRVNDNNGEIFVKVQNGFELNEIHDVDLKTTLPSGNEILAFEGAPVNLWKNKTIPAVLGYTPAADANVVHRTGDESISGFKTFTNNIYTNSTGSANVIEIQRSGSFRGRISTESDGFGLYATAVGDAQRYGLRFDYGDSNFVATYAGDPNSPKFYVSSSSTVTSNSFYAPIYYDNNNTAYYLDPASTSNLYGLTVNQSISGSVTGSASNLSGSINFATSGISSMKVNDTRYWVTDPNAPGNYFQALTMGNGSDFTQIGVNSSQEMYFRFNGSGNIWNTVLSSNNYSSFAVPLSRTITINGTSYDLSANRSWTVSGTVTSGVSITSAGSASNTPSTPSVNIGMYVDTYAFIDLSTANTNGGWIDFSKADGSDYGGRIRYVNGSDYFSISAGATEQVRIFNSNAEAIGSFRAPIFYDSNNTGYYLDPASTTNLNLLTTANAATIGGILSIGNSTNTKIKWGGNTTPTLGLPFTATANALWLEVNNGDTGGVVIDDDGVTVYGAGDNGYVFRVIDEDVYQGNSNVDASTTFYVAQGANGGGYMRGILNVTDYLTAGNSARAPIFYDSNNTGYYLDPASTSNLNSVAASMFTGRLTAMYGTSSVVGQVQTSSSINMGIAAGNYGYGISTNNIGGLDIMANQSGQPIRFWSGSVNESPTKSADFNGTAVNFYGNTYSYAYRGNGNVGGTGEATWHPSGIYCGSTMWQYGGMYKNNTDIYDISTGYANGSLRAPIFYDNNNTGYYCDPSSTSYMNVLQLANKMIVGSFPQLNTNTGEAWIGRAADRNVGSLTVQLGGNSASGRVFEVIDYAWTISLFNVTSGGTATAYGDIVAYSDKRVKENVYTIKGALNKVLSLRGVTYNRIDSEDKSQKIGVIAQEVQEILPQVVHEQENGMLGVSYGNITAVLIEAIKEQQTQIEELKELVNKLINK